MKNFLLLVALILSFAFDARADLDATSAVICKIMGYTHGIGGPMITIVIIGAALLAIFGRMPWPALFALGAFTAVFFGAPAVVSKIAPGTASRCETCTGNQTLKEDPAGSGIYKCG
ncbi:MULTISPECIES: TrbC/VirB2 family protein [unclassified Wolbachia]|uniref:TrbC/VirB2 family protein n=1 Tax=unclassified Wolbachia TaxID=2640676 RepID=UPI001AE2B3FE|nr:MULTISPECIES: TrbC/VirB2 family protein [unclassified Wolbachia]QTP61882.1 TrbC/VirB2 family protein [Wolbachia endosymbiont of Wiebesia pumilae]